MIDHNSRHLRPGMAFWTVGEEQKLDELRDLIIGKHAIHLQPARTVLEVGT